MARPATRNEKLYLRLSSEAKRLLKAAAIIANCTLSEFVLGSALTKANETLADRQTFVLDAQRWTEFLAALDAPPRDLPRMARLLKAPGFFDGGSDR
ncbi:MAG: DUF1778 domain-containing protein [Desulfobacterales bacterium]|nr:DUF1778 domain-containing protein [Desulfobacterales bacterium]